MKNKKAIFTVAFAMLMMCFTSSFAQDAKTNIYHYFNLETYMVTTMKIIEKGYQVEIYVKTGTAATGVSEWAPRTVIFSDNNYIKYKTATGYEFKIMPDQNNIDILVVERLSDNKKFRYLKAE